MDASTVLQAGLSVPLGLVFLSSAIPKLRHPKGFILTVLEYRVLPTSLGMIYGRLLPLLELFLALLLLTGTAVRSASVITSLLLVSFIVAISVNLARGRDLDCGCFGRRGSRRIGWPLVVQDLGLLAASVALGLISGPWEAPAYWSLFRLAHPLTIAFPAAVITCVVATAASAISLRGVRRSVERRWARALLND